MVDNPPIILWDTKLKLGITNPSSLITTTGNTTGTIWTFENLSIARNREQRTIMSVTASRRGFVTVEGDFVVSFTVPETDPATEQLEKMYSSNAVFDLTLNELSDKNQWKIASVLAKGCMFENMTVRYDPNDKPVREYTLKYLENVSQGASENAEEVSQRGGDYPDASTVSITW